MVKKTVAKKNTKKKIVRKTKVATKKKVVKKVAAKNTTKKKTAKKVVKKKVIIKQKPTIKKNANHNSAFILLNGKRLSNIKELADIMEEIEDHVFNHHVSENHNDFENMLSMPYFSHSHVLYSFSFPFRFL